MFCIFVIDNVELFIIENKKWLELIKNEIKICKKLFKIGTSF